MGIVEIHIRDEKVQTIEGNGAYVFVHDHDIAKTTTMIFKHQKEEYDNDKNSGRIVPEDTRYEDRHIEVGSRIQIDNDEHV